MSERSGKGAHIRERGEEVKAGETVLHKGDILRPPEVGMLATLGHAYVYVYQRPIVAILSTGDELVDLDEPFTMGKVICSNTTAWPLKSVTVAPRLCPSESRQTTKMIKGARISEGLRADVIVTSGGVSVGK